MSRPSSAAGRRAAALLRVRAAVLEQPEPNRAQRRAAAKRARKQQ